MSMNILAAMAYKNATGRDMPRREELRETARIEAAKARFESLDFYDGRPVKLPPPPRSIPRCEVCGGSGQVERDHYLRAEARVNLEIRPCMACLGYGWTDERLRTEGQAKGDLAPRYDTMSFGPQ